MTRISSCVISCVAGPPFLTSSFWLADQKTMDTFPELRVFWHKHYANAIRAAGQAGAKVIGSGPGIRRSRG